MVGRGSGRHDGGYDIRHYERRQWWADVHGLIATMVVVLHDMGLSQSLVCTRQSSGMITYSHQPNEDNEAEQGEVGYERRSVEQAQ